MKVVVCTKQVPDTTDVRIDPETNNLVREGVPSTINPFDASAMEAALRLKDNHDADVIAVCMGPPQAEAVLRYALEMGADHAYLVTDRKLSGADTLATGYALSAFIKTLQPDLILCGAEAVDGCTGQVGPIIAENLGWPQFTYVEELRMSGDEVEVTREVKEGFELLKAKLPAVVCVQKHGFFPRERVHTEKKVTVLSADEAGLDKSRIGIEGSPTRVVHVDVSNRSVRNYVEIDSSLPAKERIRMIINGGIEPKKINLVRGSQEELAQVILDDPELRAFIAD